MEKIIRELCIEVGAYMEGEIMKEKEIISKELNSLVSYVDRNAEKMLIEKLSKILPEASFLAEEQTKKVIENSALEWIIDPLDGTTNYLHRVPAYAISIGLRDGDEIVVGAVYNIPMKRFYYAEKGRGATVNGEKIFSNFETSLSDSLVATGFPYTDFATKAQYLAVFEQFLTRCRGIRRLGSAAIDLAMTAEGVFGGFFEWGLNAWDVAGGALIAKESGCKVTDFSGNENWLHGGQILVAPEQIHEEMLRLFDVWHD